MIVELTAEILQRATDYVDAQIVVMKKYGSAPVLTEDQHEALVVKIARITLKTHRQGEIMNELSIREIAEKPAMPCPFCGDNSLGGFDLIGLKAHLSHGDCEVYESVDDIRRVF